MKDNLLGTLVQAKNGRDRDDYFVVIKESNDYVFIANGKNRTVIKPKKKKLKHLKFLGVYSEYIKQKLANGILLQDSEIRNEIKNFIK